MTDGEALIHLRVPVAVKARWVRESRAASMRLTDWITQCVDSTLTQQMTAHIVIPDDVQFSDLKLSRDTSTGDIEFDWAPIERICIASGIDISVLRDQDEGNLAELLTVWYRAHRDAGGEPDSAMDDLIAEAAAEDDRGGGYSHRPGRA